MKVSYSWLTEYFSEDIPSAEAVAELLTFHAFEIDAIEDSGNDVVIDIDVLPNRSSDCLSHRGIAREIATLTGVPLVNDPLSTLPALPLTDAMTVSVEDANDCPRFTATLMTGVTVKESPKWLRERLEVLGIRSINNIVDATNYVMYAIGQPLHAYDAELFPREDGMWRFAVRRAKAGEKIALLAEGSKHASDNSDGYDTGHNDRILTLQGGELLIVDDSSNTPIGLAGVKGGQYAGVHADTTQVIIEAAHFHPTLTRKTARGLGIVIDASKRFENEPSRELPLYAQGEVTALIKDVAGGACEGVLDTYLEKKPNPEVTVRASRVNALLGLSLDDTEMVSIVRRLGAEVKEVADGFTATAPFERTDLLIEEDFIEEIGRIHGLTHIESVVPAVVPLGAVNARQAYTEKIRSALTAIGFSEVITSSFVKKDSVQLANALASDKSCLRSSLRTNMETVLALNAGNQDLLGLAEVRVFEIGTVFMKTDDGITEHLSLALGVRKKAGGYTPKDDVSLQAAIATLNELFETELMFIARQGIAETNLTDVLNTLPTPTAYEPFTKTADATYRPYSVYPAVSRDIAMWVGKTITAEQIAALLQEYAGALLVRVTLFDEFTKDGRTSFAFRLVFQSFERTLTDSEVNTNMDRVYDAVVDQGWEVR